MEWWNVRALPTAERSECTWIRFRRWEAALSAEPRGTRRSNSTTVTTSASSGVRTADRQRGGTASLSPGRRCSKHPTFLWRDHHDEVTHAYGVRSRVRSRPGECRHGRSENSGEGEGREGGAIDVPGRTDHAGPQCGASSHREGRRRAGVWRGWQAQGGQAGHQWRYLHPNGDESP